MIIPKYLANHEAIEEVNYWLEISEGDYKWNVVLKDGWVWKNGRNAGGQFFSFNNKSEFDWACPIKKTPIA